MKRINETLYRLIPCLTSLVLLLLPVVSHADPGKNYCIQPPFISAARTPNLLMLIDNSASMYDMGYMAGATATTSGTCQLPAGASCFDDSYDNTKDYEGYFSQYDSSTNKMVYPNYQYSGDRFTEVAAVPTSGGTYRTSYLYVEMTGDGSLTPSTRAVSSFIASGRFLNWLASSKFDIEKKILTGGKYDTTNQVLLGESRGCNGRRFVKALPATSGVTGITFAVRGPNSVEPNYNPSTQGGAARIEIFEGTYNQNDCQCAVYNWTSGNYGQASTDTGNCLNTTNADKALATLNHAQQTCWLIKDNISKGRTTDPGTGGGIWQGINTQDIETACANVYTDVKNPIDPSALTDESNGNYICTSAATHAVPPSPYDVDGPDTKGFVGSCWQGSGNAQKFVGNGGCVKREILHYCYGVNFTEVTDPSSSTTAGTGNIPAVLMDAGVRAIGNPVGPSDGTKGKCSVRTTKSCTTDSGCSPKVCSNDSTRTCLSNTDCASPGVCKAETCDNPFFVNVGISTVPRGLIQDFSSAIRFGAMSFNDFGTAAECGGSSKIACPMFCGGDKHGKMCTTSSDCVGSVSCQSVDNLDGGHILKSSYIGDPLGDHSAGLINSIDIVEASSWTPFAEAFYNAIAYFTKDATTTNASLDSTKFSATANAIASPLNGTNDVAANRNPIQYRCQLNNILLISDGASTADAKSTMTTKVTDSTNIFRDPSTTSEPTTCGNYSGSPYLHDLSYFAQHRNIFDPSKVCPAPIGSSYTCETAQTIKTYAIYTGPVSTSTTDMCDPYAQMYQTAAGGGTVLKTPADPIAFRNDLKDTLQKIAAGAASGTAASILSNSEGSGANILQAVFYPTKIFEDQTSADWIGEMQNLWYYVDPYISNSTIREDTDYTGSGNHELDLTKDYVARFFFDTTSDKTMVQRSQDTNGDGTPDTDIGVPIDPDYVKSIWRAGKLLWERDISASASPRKIKTTINGTSLIDFSSANLPGGSVTSNAATLAPYLNVTGTVAPTLIDWVHGQDMTGYRSRSVAIKDPVTEIVSPRRVWRLGDIISSTPRVQSTVRLNTYNLPPPGGYNDATYQTYISSSDYQDRGMVYVGGNDGMFHAFKLGKLSVKASGAVKATLSGTDLGKEEWAFIPKNALPYLQYLADPLYAHLYSVDGKTSIFDASIGDDGTGGNYWDQVKTQNSWRTVVVGGMGLGGASRNNDSTCNDGPTGTCVKTPVSGVGYSSYFALDVTNPISPSLLWEFSNTELGYATGGPAIVRVGDRAKNGRWFAVFGSGPTGPIDTDSRQFLGTSDQRLKFFVVDLLTGKLVRTIDTYIEDAFVGSMLGGSIDTDRSNPLVAGNYQDDAIYLGYVKKATDGTWTNGGVGRIMTMESSDVNSWAWRPLLDNIGPVTTSIARTQDKKNQNLWLYFGTGRYYYRNVNSLDDKNGARALYGIKDPCYNTMASPGNFLDKNCSAAITSSLVNQTSTISSLSAGDPGWQINLDAATTAEGAERVVTDTVALTNGTVFFTSFKPTTDLCGYGGNSFLWGVNYDTGGQAAANALHGKALIQLSTGEFREVDLSTAFTDKGGRRMLTPMTGKPPSDAPPIISNSQNKPLKKILHIREH